MLPKSDTDCGHTDDSGAALPLALPPPYLAATDEPTRRTVLACLGVGTAAVTLAAVPHAEAAGDDARLFAAERRLLALKVAWDEANDRYNEAEEKYYAALPPRPAFDPLPDDIEAALCGVGLSWPKATVGEIDDLARFSPEHPFNGWIAQQREKYAEAVPAWEKMDDRLREHYEVDEASEADSASGDAFMQAAQELLEEPAHTFAGVMVKIRVFDLAYADCADAGEAAALIFADIRRLADGGEGVA
jgi:hypothetical protein